jgi:hypothetical protein
MPEIEVKKGYSIYKKIVQDNSYPVGRRKHQGRDHLIVPVIMMVEGVHIGSFGPLFHSIEELGKIPESWNGRPVVINHPEVGGINVSANDPDIIDSQTVGYIYNTYVKDNKKLAAEAWIDEEKLRLLSEEILILIQAGMPLEVSLGMFLEEELTAGDWNGEHYEAIARNLRPDHLALLPGAVGACSLADGCGLGVNKSDDLSINLIKKEVSKMADITACAPCVKKKVDELIANSQGKYTESHREMLETLSEDLLDKISTPIEKVVETVVEKTIEVNVLSAEDKAVLDEAKVLKKERREANIKEIQTNAKDWTLEELNSMNDSQLKKIAGMVKKEEIVDYSVGGGHFIRTNESAEEPLPPTGVVFK